MPRTSRELWWALGGVVFATLAYLLVIARLKAIPAASGLFGHAIGILGFLLMLMTEVLYSLRKRSRVARWGRMSDWLSFHIFTGILGPYLVLLHSSWKFNGLAGVTMLLTVVIVLSGFIGRYIYTAVPRTADGVALEASQVEQAICQAQSQLQAAASSLKAKEMKKLSQRQAQLQRQLDSLANTRRLLALWHSIHIPIGMALFTAAIIHAVAALYYATLLR
jgi:uncharacterized membrane protein (DUF106 family)